MNFIHTAAHTFCTISFLVGIVSQLIEGTRLQKSIKIFIGLYILVVVTQTANNTWGTPLFEPIAFSSSVTETEIPSYKPVVLEQCCADLEQYAEFQLQQMGIEASIHLELVAENDNVVVQTVYLQIADESLVSDATEYLCREFKVNEITIV